MDLPSQQVYKSEGLGEEPEGLTYVLDKAAGTYGEGRQLPPFYSQ